MGVYRDINKDRSEITIVEELVNLNDLATGLGEKQKMYKPLHFLKILIYN